MNDLIAYLLKVSAGTILLYLCFALFFRKDTFYFRNRIILILTLLLPLVIPLIKITRVSVTPEEIPIGITVINSAMTVGETFTGEVNSFDYNGLIITLWLGIAALVMLRTLFGLMKTAAIIRKGTLKSDKFPKLIISDMDYPPFSFWPYAVIPRKIFENGDADDIITHENAHIRQGHTFDLIICELYTSLFWFNPASWLIKKSIRLNHEFLADQQLTRCTVDIKKYEYKLLNIPEGFNRIQLAHSFNNLIKNRIVMINKKPTRTYATLKNLLIFPVVAIIFAAFSLKALPPIEKETVVKPEEIVAKLNAPEVKGTVKELADARIEGPAEKKAVQKEKSIPEKQDETKVYSQVDQMPQYPGGEIELMKLIRNNLKYPVIAAEKGISGTVLVQFVVSKNGKITRIKVVRGIGSGCDEEAIRVLEKMPDWTPGKQGGRVVNVACTIPFKFVFTSKGQESQPGSPSLKGDFGEVNVTAYGIPKTVEVRKTLNVDSLLNSDKKPIVFLDNREVKISEVKLEDVASISVLRDESATKVFGEKGKNGVILISSKQEEQRLTVDGELAYTVVEQMPQYLGGDPAMMKFIKENLKYPVEAQEKNIQGSVIVSFVVDKEGRIRNPRVMRSPDESLSVESLKVLNLMPVWIPGKQGGRAVNVSYTVPFKFVMN